MDEGLNILRNFTLISADQQGFVWNTEAVVKSVIFGVVTICTSFGNLAVLLAVMFRRKTLNLSTHRLIANLAFADFLVGIVVMPVLASYTITGRWYFGQIFCTVWSCIHFWLCSASILSITAICLDRYIGVQYPLHHYRMMSSKKVMMLSACVWTLAGCLSCIPLFVWPEPVLPEDGSYACKLNHQLGHVIVVSFFIFYIPLGIMIILYWKIYRIAMGHFKRVREGYMQCPVSLNTENMRIHVGSNNSHSSSNNTHSSSGSGSRDENESSGNQSSSEQQGSGDMIEGSEKDLLALNYQRQSKTAKKVSIIVGAFVLSYFPFFTAFLIKSLNQDAISLEALIMMAWIRYFNSCINPIIYAVMLKPFRKAFLYMFEKLMTTVTCKQN